jgi:hypothetical protein
MSVPFIVLHDGLAVPLHIFFFKRHVNKCKTIKSQLAPEAAFEGHLFLFTLSLEYYSSHFKKNTVSLNHC